MYVQLPLESLFWIGDFEHALGEIDQSDKKHILHLFYREFSELHFAKISFLEIPIEIFPKLPFFCLLIEYIQYT